MSPLYQVNQLRFSYRLGDQPITALHDVSLDLEQGAFACFFGPSGSGKTTLLNVLGLIEPPQGGQVLFDGRKVGVLPEAEKNRIRKHHLGFVFQSFNLFPVLSAEENVEFFLARAGVPASERRRRVESALKSVGLIEQRQQRPFEMSGGQRQRVAIARALAKNPKVIIADEPTANLDQATGLGIMELLKSLNREKGITLILSSHDPMVQAFADRRIRLKDGRLDPLQAEGGAR